MYSLKLGDQLECIESSIEGEGLGDDVQSFGEFSDSFLSLGMDLLLGELRQMDIESHFTGASTWYDIAGFKGSFHDTDGIMHGPVNLI